MKNPSDLASISTSNNAFHRKFISSDMLSKHSVAGGFERLTFRYYISRSSILFSAPVFMCLNFAGWSIVAVALLVWTVSQLLMWLVVCSSTTGLTQRVL